MGIKKKNQQDEINHLDEKIGMLESRYSSEWER